MLSIFLTSLSTISLSTTRLYTLICLFFIALEKASRHDALTCVSATAQILDINQDLKPKYMCLDSASDNNSIYQFFQEKNIIPLMIIINEENRLNLKQVNLSIRMVYQSAVAVIP